MKFSLFVGKEARDVKKLFCFWILRKTVSMETLILKMNWYFHSYFSLINVLFRPKPRVRIQIFLQMVWIQFKKILKSTNVNLSLIWVMYDKYGVYLATICSFKFLVYFFMCRPFKASYLLGTTGQVQLYFNQLSLNK